MSEPVDMATQLAREFAALNTATERAHQAIADMRAERKLLASLLIGVREATIERADSLIMAALTPKLERASVDLSKAVEQATESVFAKFDRLSKMITGEEGHPDRPPIEGLIRAAQQRGRI